MSCLIIADHFKPEATLRTITAITQSKLFPHVTVLTGSSQDAQQFRDVAGLSRIFFSFQEARADAELPEVYSRVVKGMVKAEPAYTHIVAPTTSFGRALIPRIAGALDAPCDVASDVSKIVSRDTFVRHIFSGKQAATVRLTSKIKLATIKPNFFPLPERRKPAFAVVQARVPDAEKALCALADGGCCHVPRKMQPAAAGTTGGSSNMPQLTSARVVVAGGRGLRSKEAFKSLYGLADLINGGCVGASRSAVDLGFCENTIQVGQTGVEVAPEFYFAFGISGAVQHLAGMKDSKTVIAVNTDGNAPIFSECDYGLVGDAQKTVAEIEQALRK